MVNISNNFSEFLQYNSFFYTSFNLSNIFIFSSNLNNLFILFANLFNSFHYDWNLDNLLNNILNVSIYINKLRTNLFNFNYSRNFNHLLMNSLNLINFGNNYCLFNNFFYYAFCSYNFLTNLLHWNDLLYANLNLFDLFFDIRNLFNDLSDFSINNNLLLNSDKLNWLRLNGILAYDFFNNTRNLNNFFNCFAYWN